MSKHWKIFSPFFQWLEKTIRPGAAAALFFAITGLPASADSIKVMSFNLRYSSAAEDQGSWKQWDSPSYSPQRRQFVCRVISNRAPDLVGFQEGETNQLDYLDAQLPAQYAIERQRPSGGSGNEHAAFAYNTNSLQLLDRGVFSLGPSSGGGYWNNPPGTNFNPYLYFPDMGLSFPRIALWGKFRRPATGQEFIFATTHFDFNNGPQVSSARLIIDDAQSRNNLTPLSRLAVAVGDFNSSHTNNDWKLFTGTTTNGGITGDYTDSWYQVYGSWANSGTIHGYTGGTQSAASRIDWILHRGGLAATQCVIVTDSTITTNTSNGSTNTMYPSDHYPVMATLQFPPAAADFDRDGLPDAIERSETNVMPADADTDNDGLLDGEEDLDGDGVVDGGETDPAIGGNTQKPTDIRNYAMDGLRDRQASLLASRGLDLYWRFDGRYLYVATQDAGEGSDHFIFVATNPASGRAAPWAKSGQVGQWAAYLADENDSDYRGWFDSASSSITNLMLARASTYFENAGNLEGVLDLAQIFGAGFTNIFYLAATAFGTADGGTNQAAIQVPAGNGDGNILGTNEFVRIDPGDMDHDGINDFADADKDGDGLPDAWETAHGLSPGDNTGTNGAAGDPDGDGASNLAELGGGDRPNERRIGVPVYHGRL